MKKIESARIVRNQKGDCDHPYCVSCMDCFNNGKCAHDYYKLSDEERLSDAERYIKRHEGKKKKQKQIDYSPYMKKEIEKKPEFVDRPENIFRPWSAPTEEPEVDHIVDKHEKVVPQPIKVDIPEHVYCYEGDSIHKIEVSRAKLRIGKEKNLCCVIREELYKCYRTAEEAMIVAGWEVKK